MRSILRCLIIIGVLASFTSCGGGGGSSTPGITGSTAAPVVVTSAPQSGDNVQPISVNAGPTGSTNLAFTSVTVCVPGTSQCKTIDNVFIDTGSVGLRVLASALNGLSLPQQSTDANHVMGNCIQFVDTSHLWGAVRLADVKIAGETANSLQIQVVGDNAVGTAPSACPGTDMSSVAELRGNGILGVGNYVEDCGLRCSIVSTNQHYFDCVNTICTQITVANVSQVQNPVAHFSTDNNGVIFDLPAIPATGATRADGWIIFGIGTQTNNQLGSASIHTFNNNADLYTQYNGVVYSQSFIDSGSNGLFFPDSSIPNCTSASGFFCPTTTLNLSGSIFGQNDTGGTIPVANSDGTTSYFHGTSISFSVTNAEKMNGNFAAFNNLAGSYSDGFDWGLPFFFGRKIYTGFETNPEGPFIAF